MRIYQVFFKFKYRDNYEAFTNIVLITSLMKEVFNYTLETISLKMQYLLCKLNEFKELLLFIMKCIV